MLSILGVGGCGTILVLAFAARLAAAGTAATPADSIPSVTGSLTLARALDLASRFQLNLRAGDLRALAAQSRVRDAGRWQNPVLGGTEENFGGSLGSDRLESTLQLGQVFELGGDRGARTAVAEGERRVAASDASVLRREILSVTADRFIEAWSLQARIARLRQGETLRRDAVVAAEERYRAGASPELERSRAESQALAVTVERQRAESELAIARRALALTWGEGQASFDSLVADTEATSEPPAPSDWTTHPDVERARANEALALAQLRAAEAARVPDLTVSGGVRRLEEAGGTGFVAAVELPLPLWNRATGNLAAIRQEHDATLAETQATLRRLEVERADAIERLRSAQAILDTLRLRLRPAREHIVEELLRAYRAGRLNYLDLIAEQRGLLEADLALLDAEADAWRSRVRLDLLVGQFPASAKEGR